MAISFPQHKPASTAAIVSSSMQEMSRFLLSCFPVRSFLRPDRLYLLKMPQPKTRPDSPVPSLQGPCVRSLKSEEPWRWGPLLMYQPQWSPERPLPPPQFPWLLRSTMRSSLRLPAQVEGTEGFLTPPEKDRESPSSKSLEARFPYHDSRAMTLAVITQMSSQESPSSTGNYQADEQAGIMHLSWQLSSRWERRNHSAQLAIIKPMSRQ